MRIRSLIALVVVGLSSCLLASENQFDIEQVVRELDEKGDKVGSYIVDWKIALWTEDNYEDGSGKLMYKRPDKYRLEVTDGEYNFLMIENGEKYWVYNPEHRFVLVDKPRESKTHQDIIRHFDLDGVLEGFVGLEVKINVTLTNYNGKEAYLFIYEGEKTFKYYIDKSTGLLLKLELIDKSGKLLEKLTCENYKIDVPIKDELFTFEITDDMQVMKEMTEEELDITNIPPETESRTNQEPTQPSPTTTAAGVAPLK